MRKQFLIALAGMLLSACAQSAPIDAPTAGAAEPPPPTNDGVPADRPIGEQTYTAEEIVAATKGFFGDTTEGLAKAVEKAFAEQGRPNAYIIGEEGSGAVGIGPLNYKGGGGLPVYWQGPSVGWDFGGNASKVVTLVYNLRSTSQLFQRYPGVDGSLYFVAGVGMNYQRNGNITLAPIRTGVGLRAGANVGYLHYTPKASWIPF